MLFWSQMHSKSPWNTLPQTSAMIKTQNVHVGYCSVRNLFVHRALSWFSYETFLCRGRTCYKTRPSWPILKPQRARSLKTPVLELKRLWSKFHGIISFLINLQTITMKAIRIRNNAQCTCTSLITVTLWSSSNLNSFSNSEWSWNLSSYRRNLNCSEVTLAGKTSENRCKILEVSPWTFPPFWKEMILFASLYVTWMLTVPGV